MPVLRRDERNEAAGGYVRTFPRIVMSFATNGFDYISPSWMTLKDCQTCFENMELVHDDGATPSLRLPWRKVWYRRQRNEGAMTVVSA